MLELQRNVFVIRRWWWLLVLGAIVGGLVAFGLTKVLVKTKYEAQAVVSSGPAPQGQHGAYFAVNGSGTDGQLLPNNGVLNAVQRAVPGLDRTALLNNIDGSASQQDCVSLNSPVDTSGCQLLTIRVQWTDPATAIKLANTVVTVFIQQEKQRLAQGYALFHQINTQQERALTKLVRTTPGAGEARNWLQAQYANAISQLYQDDASRHVKTAIAQASLQVAAPATKANKASGPKGSVNGALGALIGLLIAWAIAFIATSSYGDTSESAIPRPVLSTVRD